MGRRPSCECGVCSKCKRRDHMRAKYWADPDAARERARAARLKRLEAARAYDRARGFRETDQVKIRARRAVRDALAAGTLTREPCEVCGSPESEAHHDDHREPLDVRWLCRPHHGRLHRLPATEGGLQQQDGVV